MTPLAPSRAPRLARRLALLLATASLFTGTLAQGTPATLDLDAALAAREGRVAVVTAALELAEAERALVRSDADPLSLRLERTQARQGVELATAELAAARADAAVELAGAWTRVREAQAQVALAEAARDLAGRVLDVAQLRLERGSATRLDVEEAATDLDDANANVMAARDGLALARADLAGTVGSDALVDVAPVDRDRLEHPLPSDDVLAAAVSGLPAYLSVAHAVELAAIGVELLDPSFAAQAQIDRARSQLAQAEAGLAEAERGLGLQLRALRNAVANAIERDRVARDALGQAEERLAIEEQRLAAGLVAELSVDQVRLGVDQARLTALQAEHALLLAWLDLEAGALLDLGVGRGF